MSLRPPSLAPRETGRNDQSARELPGRWIPRRVGARSTIGSARPVTITNCHDAAMVRPDVLIPAYAQQRQTFAEVMADSTNNGDNPATVAKVIVAAATDASPKLRYPAGTTASRVSALRRFVPVRVFESRSARSAGSPPDPLRRSAHRRRLVHMRR